LLSSPREVRYQADPIVNERIAREHKEEDHPLEDPGHLVGESNGYLRRFPTKIGECENEPCSHDSERIQTAQKSNDNGSEPVARRNCRPQLTDGARYFRNAS